MAVLILTEVRQKVRARTDQGISNLWFNREEETGISTRVSILGHIQRGGSPTATDRVHASVMGAFAVDLLCEGKSNRVVAYKDGKYVDFDIEEALAMQKDLPEYVYQVSRYLTI